MLPLQDLVRSLFGLIQEFFNGPEVDFGEVLGTLLLDFFLAKGRRPIIPYHLKLPKHNAFGRLVVGDEVDAFRH